MPNRLAAERSPYLLQHADNPVDWFPWGEEAFAKARAEDKPIFLSIGYSTCHWCHVMEHESFESPAVAAVAQPRLREHQARSRGTPGRRSRLHDVRAGDDRRWRVADERLADAGPQALLRRHVFSADLPLGTSGVRRRARAARACLDSRTQGPRSDRSGCRRTPSSGYRGRLVRARSRAGGGRPGARSRHRVVRSVVRRAPRRIRRRAEVSAAVRAAVPAPRVRAHR